MAKPIRLLIAEPDADYGYALLRYAGGDAYGDRIEPLLVTDEALLAEYLADGQGYDIALVSEQFGAQLNEGCDLSRIVMLTETPFHDNKGEAVYKFRAMPELLETVLRTAERHADERIAEGSSGRKTMAVAFYSAGSGTGKTTILQHVAALLVRRCRSILLVQLDPYSLSRHIPFDHVRLPVPELLYQVKFGDGGASSFSPDARIAAIADIPGREWLDLSREHCAALVRACKEFSGCDYVLVDLPGTLDQPILGALDACDRVVWIHTEDEISCDRTEKACRVLGKLPGLERLGAKSSFVANRSIGGTRQGGIELPPDIASLPYMPQWKLARPEAGDDISIFTEHIERMWERISKGVAGT